MEGRGVHLVPRTAGISDNAGGIDDECRGAREVDRVVREANVRAPTLGARAVVVDQDRERKRVFSEPGGDVLSLLAKDDQNVEAA